MTEKTATKGPVRLLSDCAKLSGFDPAEGWPDELPVKGIINLLAEAWRISNEGRKEWTRLVSAAIKRGDLVTLDKSRTIPGKTVKVGSLAGYGKPNHWATGHDPQLGYTLPPETIVTLYATRTTCAAWLQAIGETTDTLSACALAWLGDAWQERQEPETATSKPRSKAKASEGAADTASRPEERQAYMRTLWLEMGEPKNQSVWNEMKKRAGKAGQPIIAVIGNADFTFSYADGGTEPLTKKVFQNDMSKVKNR